MDKDRRYNIIVTNDDGIGTESLMRLVEQLGSFADVYVVAPMEQQSGKSHSITYRREVSSVEHTLRGAVEAFAIDGTPVDCVKWAIFKFKEEGITPDFLVSGINLGHNAGLAMHYSGTIAAAREGALNGIRSIALSVDGHNASHFDYLLGALPRLLEMSAKISPATLLSVNAPDIPSWDIKGLKVVPAAPFGYAEKFSFTKADSGNLQMLPEHFELDGNMRYDIDWLKASYVAVSPIPAQATDPVAVLKLRGLTRAEDCLTVIVDAQQKMLGRVRKPARFERKIECFVHAVSRMARPVLFTETHGMGDILPALTSYASEAEKVVHILPDAWTAPDMEKYATCLDPQKILIAGASSNAELMQTALGFVERGYEVTVIEDCCAAPSKSDHKTAMRMLANAGCNISTFRTEVMLLAGECEKPVLDSVTAILNE